MWPDTRMMELLGIDLPIVQAPMAGATTPALAAAVSEAPLGKPGRARDLTEALVADALARLNATNRA